MMKPHSTLVFKESFAAFDASTWNVEVGDKWHNEEKQCYVHDAQHLQFTKDGLRLIADVNPSHYRCRYQSVRMNTKGKREWQYGTFRVRARLPKGRGSWPAIWFLGHDIGPVRWPLCGEIDLMETVGHDPEVIHFSLHSQKHNHIIKTQRTSFHKVPGILEGFHDYELIWRQEGMTFSIDGHPYAVFEKPVNVGVDNWPFDKPYYLILNIAVGGTWGGPIHESDMPFIMDIQHVEVFQ